MFPPTAALPLALPVAGVSVTRNSPRIGVQGPLSQCDCPDVHPTRVVLAETLGQTVPSEGSLRQTCPAPGPTPPLPYGTLPVSRVRSRRYGLSVSSSPGELSRMFAESALMILRPWLAASQLFIVQYPLRPCLPASLAASRVIHRKSPGFARHPHPVMFKYTGLAGAFFAHCRLRCFGGFLFQSIA